MAPQAQIGMFPEMEEPVPDAGSDIAYTKPETCAGISKYIGDRWKIRGAIWEPCSGAGNWIDPLSLLAPVVASELDPKALSVVRGRAQAWNALQGPPPGSPEIGAVITNPPFSLATQFLKVALGIPTCNLVALLIRQGWFAPVGKYEERRLEYCWGPIAKPAEQVLLVPRVPFEGPERSGTGTDNIEYGMLIWERQRDGGWFHRGPVAVWRLDWKTGTVM